ncbi:MAG: PAS domain S-box protein, partial [Ginsengibacter sp.]
FKNDLTATSLHKSIIYCLERKKRIHQLKESEKRYSELFRLNPQPIWIYDLETYKFVQVNKAAIDLYGYTEEEFLKMSILDIRPAEDVPLVKKSITNRSENESGYRGKFRHFTKAGKLLVVEIQSNFVVFKDRKYRLVIISDITEKNITEHQITRAIIKTQENERYEIGAELHDNICQILASTHISLGVLAKSVDPSGMELYRQCREYITLATQEIRNLSHRLAPAFFNDSTLEEAFDILLSNSNVENKYDISLYFDEKVLKSKINRDLQLNLYRILQEQLRNILKYAKCKTIEVDLIVKNKKLKMRIADDGIGFDMNVAKGGIGLSNMRRRVELFDGKFDIDSSPGNGCELIIDIPLKPENLIPDQITQPIEMGK